jgi:hypothetical protein
MQSLVLVAFVAAALCAPQPLLVAAQYDQCQCTWPGSGEAVEVVTIATKTTFSYCTRLYDDRQAGRPCARARSATFHSRRAALRVATRTMCVHRCTSRAPPLGACGSQFSLTSPLHASERLARGHWRVYVRQSRPVGPDGASESQRSLSSAVSDPIRVLLPPDSNWAKREPCSWLHHSSALRLTATQNTVAQMITAVGMALWDGGREWATARCTRTRSRHLRRVRLVLRALQPPRPVARPHRHRCVSATELRLCVRCW